MHIKVIFVEPKYQINLGYEARVLANFGIREMHLVNPKCKYTGKQAVKYSKHAVSLLKRARVHKSIDKAISGCNLVIGTTGNWHKTDEAFFNAFTPERAKGFIKNNKKIALLIGRDGTGLTKDELKKCDFTVFVPTSEAYPILNVSHALAILLYSFTSNGKVNEHLEKFYADKKSIDSVRNLFWNLVKGNEQIRNKKAVMFAFEHVIRRANPTRKELSAMAIGLSDKRKH
jgi:TrmH family RNA methyltransferase